MKKITRILFTCIVLLGFSINAFAGLTPVVTTDLGADMDSGIVRVVLELTDDFVSNSTKNTDIGILVHQGAFTGWNDGIAINMLQLYTAEDRLAAKGYTGTTWGVDDEVNLMRNKQIVLWMKFNTVTDKHSLLYQMEGQDTPTEVYTDYVSRASAKGGLHDFARFCTVAYNDKFTDGPSCVKMIDEGKYVNAVEAYVFPVTIYGDTTAVATCENVPYMFDGMSLSAEGIYSKEIKAANGVDDSIVSIDLMLYPTYMMGDTTDYMVSDPAFKAVGMQTVMVSSETLTSCKGCDSILAEYLTLTYSESVYSDTAYVSDTTFISISDTMYTNINLYDTTYVTVSDTLTFNLVAGLSGTPENVMVKLYPNPATDMLYVSFSSISNLSNVKLELYNMTGAKVAEKAVADLKNTLDISGFSAGTYLLNIVKDGAILDNKVVIIK